MSTHSQPVQIRIADKSDAQKLTDLINLAFSGAEQFFVDEDRIDLPTVLSLLDRGNFLVAEVDEAIVGTVYLEPRGERMYLGLLSVDPSTQQTGLGSELMSAAEDHSRARNSRFIDILIVNLREDLPAFYQKRGYVETGTSPFPTEIHTKLPCHFINMSKALE
jgi:predicted N-acetyltransferase YhbS